MSLSHASVVLIVSGLFSCRKEFALQRLSNIGYVACDLILVFVLICVVCWQIARKNIA